MKIHLSTLLGYFGLLVTFIGLFSGAGLYRVWKNLIKKEIISIDDKGFKFLSYSLFTWAAGGLGILLYLLLDFNLILFKILLTGVSVLNSAYILLALPHFKHKPEKLKELLNADYYNLLVKVLGILVWSVCIIFILVGSSKNDMNPILPIVIKRVVDNIAWEFLLDFGYGFATLLALGYMLAHTFKERRINNLINISNLVILIVLIAQLLKLVPIPIDINENILSLDLQHKSHIAYYLRYVFTGVFMALLIMIFFALAYSSVTDQEEEEMSEADIIDNLEVNPNDVIIQLIPDCSNNGKKLKHGLFLNIPGVLQNELFFLKSTSYWLWLKFIYAKIHCEENLLGFFAIEKENDGKTNYQSGQKIRLSEELVKRYFNVESYLKEDILHKKLFEKIDGGLFSSATQKNIKGAGYILNIPKENYSSNFFDINNEKEFTELINKLYAKKEDERRNNNNNKKTENEIAKIDESGEQ